MRSDRICKRSPCCWFGLEVGLEIVFLFTDTHREVALHTGKYLSFRFSVLCCCALEKVTLPKMCMYCVLFVKSLLPNLSFFVCLFGLLHERYVISAVFDYYG